MTGPTEPWPRPRPTWPRWPTKRAWKSVSFLGSRWRSVFFFYFLSFFSYTKRKFLNNIGVRLILCKLGLSYYCYYILPQYSNITEISKKKRHKQFCDFCFWDEMYRTRSTRMLMQFRAKKAKQQPYCKQRKPTTYKERKLKWSPSSIYHYTKIYIFNHIMKYHITPYTIISYHIIK